MTTETKNETGVVLPISLVALIAVIAFLLLTFFGTHQPSWARGYAAGVIDATRGKATTKLVEKADGTNEWKVERVREKP